MKIWEPATSISAYLATSRPPGVWRPIYPPRQSAWVLEGLPGSVGSSQAGSQAEILGQERYQSGQTRLAGLWLLETTKAEGQHADPRTQACHIFVFSFFPWKLESWWNCNTYSKQLTHFAGKQFDAQRGEMISSTSQTKTHATCFFICFCYAAG